MGTENGGHSCPSVKMPERSAIFFFKFDLRGQLHLTASVKKCPKNCFMPAFTNTAERKMANVIKCFLIMLLLPSKTLDFKSVLKTVV